MYCWMVCYCHTYRESTTNSAQDEIARDLADILIVFGQQLNQHGPQLSGRLAFSVQSYTKLHEAMEVIRDKQVASLTVAELQAQVAEVPTVHARASLVVHLDALVRWCDHRYEILLIFHSSTAARLLIRTFSLLICRLDTRYIDIAHYAVRTLTYISGRYDPCIY